MAKCAKNVCEICTHAELVRGVFGVKYKCKIGKKKHQGSCYYFTCSGRDASFCDTCPNYSKTSGVSGE